MIQVWGAAVLHLHGMVKTDAGRAGRLRRVARLPLVLVPLGAVLALVPSVAVAAEPGVAITVGAGVLLDPTLVRIPIQVTCQPMTVETNQGRADLRQAVSGRIAFGEGWEETPIVCDGAPHPNSYLVWVDTASAAPFRAGTATVQISAFLCSGAPTFECQSGGSGIKVIDVRRPH
jgi:hypothetical protein